MLDIESIARRHDIPVDAAEHICESLGRNGGRMAQFNHPALGGMGQWHDGGMTMIGDMFNDALKARVSALCADLIPLANLEGRSSRSSAISGAWWPSELGRPSSAGSQNNARYAVFPHTRRLALENDGRITVYDTGDHQIGGVSQQQGSGRDLSFTSQLGTVRVHELKEIRATENSEWSKLPASDQSTRQALHSETNAKSVTPAKAPDHIGHQELSALERLFELHQKGVLTDAEFTAKKTEILSRI